MNGRLTDPVDDVTIAIGALSGITEQEWTTGPIAELANTLDRLRYLQSIVRKAEQAISDTLVGSMETDEMTIPGVGRITRVEKTQPSWKYPGANDQMRDDLAQAVANSISVDIATGEIDTARRNIALAAMRMAYEVIPSFSNLLKAGRERLGLHIGDYRTYSTHYTISIEGDGDA